MRLLIAPLEMKGLLTATEVAQVMAEVLEAEWPEATLRHLPLADGGPGTLDTLAVALPSLRRIDARVQDPLGRPVHARWGLLDGELPMAFVEAAQACGLSRLALAERDPARATTHGVGELIAAALSHPITRLVVGLGGSATNDGGAGALAALGARVLDAQDCPIGPGGLPLTRLARVDLSGLDPRCAQVEWQLACDVRAPLLGATGASRLFGPQKGVHADDLERFELGLTRLADALEAETGRHLRQQPGMGAAGGLGLGLSAASGSAPVSGFDVIADLVGLDARLGEVDHVLTAEGRLDTQSLLGKGPVRLAEWARRRGVPTTAFVGEAQHAAPCFDAIHLAHAGNPPTREGARSAVAHATRAWARLHRP